MIRRLLAARRARTHAHRLVHDPLAAASEQRWERRQRWLDGTDQIHAATVAFKSSGEVAAGTGNAAADSSHPPCESRSAIAAGSPGEPHRPDCIDAALARARTHLFTRPQGDPQ